MDIGYYPSNYFGVEYWGKSYWGSAGAPIVPAVRRGGSRVYVPPQPKINAKLLLLLKRYLELKLNVS